MDRRWPFIISCCLLLLNGLGLAVEMLPFQFVNTTTLPSSEIYVTLFGFNEHPFAVTPSSPRRQGFIQFLHPETGVGTFVNANSSIPSTTYSYRLSSFPAVAGSKNTYQITVPYLDSGEIFFSLHKPLSLFVSMPAPPSPQYATISNPIPGNPKDPNYSIVYDKMEFSFEPASAGGRPLSQVTVNVTAVDFFAIPLYLTLNGAQPASTGITEKRSTIMNNITKVFSKAYGTAEERWNSLILEDDDSNILRVLSPGNGLGYSYPPGVAPQKPLYFDKAYLQDWLDGVWSGSNAYYKDASNVLQVKAVVSGTMYYGLVNKTTGNFEFWKSASRSGRPDVTIPLAATATLSIFEAVAPWPGSTPTNQDAYDIGRLLQAGIMTGYLPCRPNRVLSKETLTAAATASKLYKVNKRLPSSLQSEGPFYDLYSAAIFPYGNGAYTWAWDDLVYTSAAPSLSKLQADTYVKVQLGDLSDLDD